uniref:Uncharacterized protein n=1 Tax=Anguilla anguilla TaxID=7936 RepID=A0A0E9RKV7_ANGAN
MVSCSYILFKRNNGIIEYVYAIWPYNISFSFYNYVRTLINITCYCYLTSHISLYLSH